MKVGFIGLGIMGKPMSKNLLKAGYELVVFDFNKDAVKEVTECGAVIVSVRYRRDSEYCMFLMR